MKTDFKTSQSLPEDKKTYVYSLLSSQGYIALSVAESEAAKAAKKAPSFITCSLMGLLIRYFYFEPTVYSM